MCTCVKILLIQDSRTRNAMMTAPGSDWRQPTKHGQTTLHVWIWRIWWYVHIYVYVVYIHYHYVLVRTYDCVVPVATTSHFCVQGRLLDIPGGPRPLACIIIIFQVSWSTHIHIYVRIPTYITDAIVISDMLEYAPHWYACMFHPL